MRLFVPLILSCLIANFVWSAPGDERWSHEFYDPSFGTVNAVAYLTNGDLICAGSFNGVAGVPGTQNIARWDGTNWWSVGGGLPNANLFALLVSGNDLFVGGTFTSVAGQPITNLTRWDGTNWSAVGGGVVGGSVRTLTLHNGALVAGGLFTSAGTSNVGYIASWDGTTWNTLSGGVQASSPSASAVPVQSILSFSGALYAGGKFYSAGGVAATNIARWNGITWESLGAGANNGTDNSVATLGVDTNGLIYAGGSFVKAGTNTVNCLASWDGNVWTGFGGFFDPNGGIIRSLVFADSGFYVSGTFFQAGTNTSISGLARWDGASWQRPTTLARHPMFSMAASGSRIAVFGGLRNVMLRQSPTKRGVIQFDGQQWSILGAGIAVDGNVSTVAAAGGSAQVSGFFDNWDGNCCRTMVAEWNGRTWNGMGNGLVVGFVNTEQYIRAFLTTNGVTYAAGTTAGGNQVVILTNSTWLDIGAPPPSTPFAFAWQRDELFLGHGSGVSKWIGNGWTNVGAGPNGSVYALAFVGDQLYAGGSFSSAGATTVNNIARWDGTNWWPLGSGVDALVYMLASWRGQLFIGGEFTLANGNPALRVAKWDGSEWTSLGDGFAEGRVYGLKVLSDGRLFAAGSFTHSGTNLINHIASWTGTTWAPLGSGVDDTILSMDSDNLHLFVGGHFFSAGGAPSLHFASWRIPQSLHVGIAGPPQIAGVSLGISGEPGTRFAVEASANLQEWNPVSTNTLAGSAMQLTVATNGMPDSFYRLRYTPE
jgi:trimeric autotransporter adhesin